nr:Ig-like domain-containing protein [Moraxella osloensis]
MAISTNLIKSFQLSALTTALALAGCGGGGGNDTLPPPVKTGTVSVTNPSTGTDSTTTTNLASVKKVQLVSTSSDFYMNVGDSVELTVYALNSNNIGVASVPVSVQITDPSVTGVFSGISPNLVTDDTGKAVIKLDIKSLTNDQKNYLKQNGLVVTTTVGKVSTSKTLKGTDVNTTTPTPTVTVSNLLLISDSQNIALVKGTKINVTALAVDKDNNIIPNTTIDFNIGNSVLSGIFANSNLSVLTNDRGEANLELELKSLSNEQVSYLLNTGLTINSTARTGSVASNTINLKGVEQGSTTTKLDVQKVNLTTPKPNFNVQVGEKFTVTASVLNSSNTGLGGVPVQFKLDDPSTTGVYAVSDTSNVVTNASGEATIELEVKSEAAKAKLLSQGINITATAKNTTGTTPVDVTNKLNILGKDPAFNENITKVSKVGLSSSLTNNEFDLTVGNTFTVTANVLDASQGALANVPVTFTLPGLDQTGIANLSGSTVTTDSQGKATINLSLTSLNATQRSYLMSNGLTINASVANGTNVAPIKLSAKQSSTLPVTVESVSVVADSDNILMTAGSTVKITAIALDKNFGGLANQTLTVKIPDPSATGVYNITGSTITTDSKGEAIFNLQIKSALTAAQKQALANGLVVDITAANGKTGQIKLSAKAVNDVVVSNVNLTSNVTNIPLSVGSQFTVTANVSDAQNGTIANSPVTFNLPSLADYGVTSLSPSTIITDDKGQAIITLQVQSLTDTQRANLLKGFTINATANGKVAPALTLTGMDTIKRFDVKAVNLSSPISKFNIKTGERFTVTASVLGANNTGIGGAPVEFTIDNPSLTGVYAVSDTTNVITNVNGEATIELEVKSEAAKQLLLTDGVTITAIAKNTLNNPPTDVSGKKTILGTDPTLSANIAKVSKALLVSSVNPFDLTVGNKLSITASIADANNGKLDGVPVSFTLPDLDKTGIANLSGSTIVTNANGEAIINLEIKSLSADQRNYLLTNGLTVKATVPNGTIISPLQLSAKNVTTPDNTIDSISVTADTNNIIMAAGSRVRVTAVALDKNFGGIKGQNLTVNIPNPALTGVFNLSGSTVTTDDKGEAIIDLEVKTTLTDAQKAALLNGLNVTVAAQNGRQGVINLAAKAANEVSVSTVNLTGSNIPLIIGSQVKVVATVLDDQKGVVKNTPVTFTLPSFADTGVASLSASTVLTDDKGEAVITLEVKSLTDAQKQALLNGFTINATSNGKPAQALILKGIKESTIADIANVNLVTNKDTLTADAGETINVTAQVRDANNVSLANMPVSFTLLDAAAATGITNTTPLQATTNADGEAVLTLKVGALTPDQKYYLKTSGLSFKATAGAITSSTVTLRTQEAITSNSVNTLLLTSDSAIQLALGSKVKVTALAIDKNGAVVPNAQVSFKVPTDSGLVNNTGAVVNTNANGEATIEVEIKDLNKATTALQNGLIVTAQSGVSVGTTTIVNASSQSATQAYNVFVSKSKDELRTGNDSLSMTIRVTDINGGIKANVPVYLQILEDGIARGLSFNKVSTLKTDDKGLVTVDLSQNDIGLVSRLNGTGKVSVIVNDGIYRAEKEVITVPITGTTVDNLFVSNKEISSTISSTISATALDGSGKPFANTKVELLLSDKSLATPKFVTTDVQGKFTFTVSQAELGQAIKYPLSLRLFGNNTQGVEISSSPISLTELSSANQTETKLELRKNTGEIASSNEILVNSTGQITILRPKDKAGKLLVEGSKVYLSTNKGTLNGQGTRVEGTVQNQQVTFSINSPVANTATLVLDYNGEQIFTDSISFLTKDVANPLILQLERTTLSTNGETNVIATVKDSNGLPVKKAIVEFSLVKDPSGGRLEKGYAITDDSGNATVKYFSGRTPTANDAVEIQANVDKIQINDKEENTNLSIKSDIKKLTVQTNATFIGFGFADKIRQHPDGRQIYYVYDGSIFVNNNIGQPAANQPVSVSIIPVQYLLGEYYVIPKIPAVSEVKDDPNTAQDESSPAVPEIPARWGIRHFDDNGNSYSFGAVCSNEDINSNGIMDNVTLTDLATGKSLIGEDFNNNGKLDPLNPATILSASGSEVVNGQTMTTDSTGKLDFSIRYTKESADWWLGMIKVTTKVNGTEFVEYRTISLPTAVEDVSQPDATPPLRPNWISPFGKRTVLSVPTNYLYIGMGKGNYALRNLKYVNVGVGNGEYIVDTSNHYPVTINNKPYCQ